jgi:hypothetical protein
VKPAAVGVFVLFASLLACGHAPPRASSPSQRQLAGSAGQKPRSASEAKDDARGPILGEYAVRYDGVGELRVEATLDRPGALFMVESGAERFVEDFETFSNGTWTRGGREGRSFVAAPCAAGPHVFVARKEAGPCRIRYRYRLRAAAKHLDDLDNASEEGTVIEAPPSTWLVAPEKADGKARVRFRVTTTESTRFCTGVYRSREVDGAWDITLSDLWTSPYSAFGPLRLRTLSRPAVGGSATTTDKSPVEQGARIELAITPGALTVSDDDLATWVADGARVIAGYFGRFPLSEALVIVAPARGRWVGFGKTLSGGGGAIFVRMGEKASARALRDDWVLVHEMTHLAFPSVAREHDWAEEGLATYVEPLARARAGMMSAEDAWDGLVDGMPNGLPAAGDRGLDRTPTWGRTYWGGALFYLLADIEIRKRTKNERGLEHALRGILAEGGSNAHRWALDDAFAAGDRATGTQVLHDLHEAIGTSPHPVDLAALWRELGIVRERGAIRFDDSAPLAAIRRAMTARGSH